MKISNLKYTATLIALAGMLSLTGCNGKNKNEVVEQKPTIKEYELSRDEYVEGIDEGMVIVLVENENGLEYKVAHRVNSWDSYQVENCDDKEYQDFLNSRKYSNTIYFDIMTGDAISMIRRERYALFDDKEETVYGCKIVDECNAFSEIDFERKHYFTREEAMHRLYTLSVNDSAMGEPVYISPCTCSSCEYESQYKIVY